MKSKMAAFAKKTWGVDIENPDLEWYVDVETASATTWKFKMGMNIYSMTYDKTTKTVSGSKK